MYVKNSQSRKVNGYAPEYAEYNSQNCIFHWFITFSPKKRICSLSHWQKPMNSNLVILKKYPCISKNLQPSWSNVVYSDAIVRSDWGLINNWIYLTIQRSSYLPLAWRKKSLKKNIAEYKPAKLYSVPHIRPKYGFSNPADVVEHSKAAFITSIPYKSIPEINLLAKIL